MVLAALLGRHGPNKRQVARLAESIGHQGRSRPRDGFITSSTPESGLLFFGVVCGRGGGRGGMASLRPATGPSELLS